MNYWIQEAAEPGFIAKAAIKLKKLNLIIKFLKGVIVTLAYWLMT